MKTEAQMWKRFSTSSDTEYLYITETNQILTLTKECDTQTDEVLIDELHKQGILYDDLPSYARWKMTPEEYSKTLSGGMRGMVLEITQQCNLRCSYCIYSGNYTGRRVHQERHMDIDMVKKCIDFYLQHNSDCPSAKISFYGGEALLEFDLIREAVRYAREKMSGKRPIRFRISSNGTTLRSNVIKWLEENEDVDMTITINGGSHDKYRRFPSGVGSLGIIMNTLNDIRENHAKLWDRIDFIANAASYSEIADLRSFYREKIGKPPMLITGIHFFGGNDVIDKILTKPEGDEESYRALCKAYGEEHDEYVKPWTQMEIENICVRGIGAQKDGRVCSSFCMPFIDSLFVSSDGVFGICEKIGADASLGNINDGFNMTGIRNLLDEALQLINEKCLHCWAQRLCSLCLSEMHRDESGKLFIPEKTCDSIRKGVEEDLRLFCEIGEKNPDLIETIRNEYVENVEKCLS